jgi:hypothetical protein
MRKGDKNALTTHLSNKLSGKPQAVAIAKNRTIIKINK